MVHFNNGVFKLVRCQQFGALLHKGLSIGFDHRSAHIDSNKESIDRIVTPPRYLMVADQTEP
jgi:hypothetical protein